MSADHPAPLRGPRRTRRGHRPRHRYATAAVAAALAALLAVALGACGYGSRAETGGVAKVQPRGERTGGLDEVRLGYFANVTHATALVGDREGFFQKELGGTKVTAQVFGAGPSAVEALNAGSVDIAWLGPSPAVNGYTRAGGRNLRIISGSASGGVSLVAHPDRVSGPDDLRGKRIATPQLGNTQDVALLHYLAEKGLRVDPDSGEGEATVLRIDNKETPAFFRRGDIDAAWVPEPTASQLTAQGGRVLLDERDLWEDGRHVITTMVVSQRFLARHPEAVEAVLRGSVKANAWIKSHPEEARASLNTALERQGGKALPPEVLDPAFEHIEVLDDPLAATLARQAEHAERAGLLENPDLRGIYDLRLLNKVLAERGARQVSAAGLGSG
ncbi:ABC transporter substrate-binding protein [Streptomyces xinghaiensis]|uniref:ABC transporter substrate-binding protein n=1 Tax=Streptomyces xinghaiensis TaxID=1038928 RepID=UPI000BAFCA7C